MINVNVDKVIQKGEFPETINNILRRIQRKDILSVGDFFKSLPDNELEDLAEMVEAATDKEVDDNSNAKEIQSLILLSHLLAQKEGIDVEREDAYKVTNTILVMIACVSLERAGLVNVKYDKMSFGSDEEFVSMKPGVNPKDYM